MDHDSGKARLAEIVWERLSLLRYTHGRVWGRSRIQGSAGMPLPSAESVRPAAPSAQLKQLEAILLQLATGKRGESLGDGQRVHR